MSSRSPPLEAQRFGRSQTPESPRPIAIPEPSNIPVLQNQMDPVFNDTATYDIRPDSQPSAAFKNTSSDSSELHYEDLNAKSHALQQSLLNDQVEAQRVQNHAAPTIDPQNPQLPVPQQTEQLTSSAPASHAIAQHYNNQVAESKEHVLSSEEAPAQPGLSIPQNEDEQGPIANGEQTSIDYESILASINASTSDIVPIATTSVPEDANVSLSVEKPLLAAIGLPPKPPLSEIPTNFAQYNMPDSFQSSYYPNPSASATTIHEIDTSPVKASPALSGIALSPSLPSQQRGAFANQPSVELQTQNAPNYIPQSSDTERPWGPEIQQIYDKFLEDERMYVTEGVWDKFPLGSRLFVGNLPTEKVTKRDLFHIFHKYGQLAQISIKQAYGFVQFLRAADCQAALQAEQGVELRERLLHLEISKPQRNTRNANQGGNRPAQRRRSRSPDRAMSRVSNDHGNYSKRPAYSDYRDEPVRRRDDYRPVRSPSPREYRSRDEHRGRDERYSGNLQSPQLGNHSIPSAGHPPLDDDAMLPLPRRAPRDVPDVQLLVIEDVGHQLVNFVEQGFRVKGLTAQTIWLNPRLALAVVIKRQIIEGVQAVVKLTRGVQYGSKIPLQVFDRTPGTTNVNFNEYVDLDVSIAADIVIQARQKERMAGQRPAPSPYPPQQGFQPPVPLQQFQQPPPTHQQYSQQPPQQQYQTPRPQSQQYHPPQPPQYGIPQQSPQTPNGGGSNLQELLANLNRQSSGNPSQPQQQPMPTQQAVPDLAGLLQNVAARQQNHGNGGYGQGQGYVPPQQQQPQYSQYQSPAPNQQYGAPQLPQQNVQNVMDQLARTAPEQDFDRAGGKDIMDPTMASHEPPEKKQGHSKLVKRKNLNRLPSARLPERLRSHGEDTQEDVTAPSHGAAASRYMNQSIFSMIAAAGSKTDFNTRFDESSDSDEESEDESLKRSDKRKSGVSKDALSQLKSIQEKDEKKGHKKKLSQHKLLQSLPKLSLRPHSKSRKSRQDPSPPSDGSSLSSNSNPRDAPMMSRLLTAEAEFEAGTEDIEVLMRLPTVPRTRDRKESSPATLLATRLMEIFGFEKPEKVVAEFPCWLLQSVLLQGYLYITRRHICFYAYLPKKSSTVSNTGYLSKRGRRNLTYSRFWFTLKGDVLSYYTNPSDQYFPQGNVDLRYGISASLSAEKEKHKDCKDFTVTTDHRTYHFRADSPNSAQEWVKILQKTIFRSHNDGDSVKISLPVENVIDVEESPVVEFAETLKIRVVESGDSYAIDEYFFSFFSFGKEVIDVLQDLVDDTPASRISQDLLSPTESQRGDRSPRNAFYDLRKSLDVPISGATTPPIRENVKATLIPFQVGDDGKQSPRMSGEFARSGNRASLDMNQREYSRASFDRGRSSEGRDRLAVVKERRPARSPLARNHDSSDENDKSADKTDSSMAMSPTADAHMSASQILTRSDVFQKPTMNRMDTLQSASTDDAPRDSIDTVQSTDREGRRPIPIKRHSSRLGRRKNVGFDASAGGSDAGSESKLQAGTASPSLQEIVKAGSYPLQRAGAFAGYLKNRSTRMSKLLATESMSYLEKVSGMWAGSRKHYGENEGVVPDDRDVDPEDEEASVGHGDRFRAHFALPKSEKLQATYFGFLHRVLPLYGKIYISNRKFCFRSLLPGTKTKLVLPLKDIENVDKEKGFRFGYHGLVIVIRGHEELFFEFSSADHRDDCTVTLLHSLESVRYMVESGLLKKQDEDDSDVAKAEHKLLQEARRSSVQMLDMKLPDTAETIYSAEENCPIVFDDPRASVINFKPTASLRITCLTIGSRGDVQPYIALCKGLLAEGHKPKIATHAEFGPWVIKHGIAFEAIDGDPAELMRICVENGMFTYSFLKEASSKFRGWIDELLVSAWKACQDSDILIESPSAMAGIHIAEALGIPYFRAFTMPWTRTRAYPHAFAVPEHKIGGAYNYFSYVMFDNVFWKAIAGQVNRWRKKELGLRSTNLDKMQPNKVPFLYNFSPHVVVPPLDYSDWVRVTGYWFLDEANDWTPPEELTNFIAKARADSKKLVYIGFGSIVVSDPAALTRTVVESVLKADVRCILSKGWSDRLGDPAAVKTEVPLPSEIHQIKSAPHDWLFAQIDAAVHHGGAGTTGASLRAGLPTIIKPFFGDQYFFGSRIEDLGVGICLKKVNVSVFSRALWEATHSERIIVKARVLGEQIRKEDGVANAIQAIYRDLDYAKTLIKARSAAGTHTSSPFGNDGAVEEEESWTFIGDESDPDLQQRIQDWDKAHLGRGPRVSMDLSRVGMKATQSVEQEKESVVRRLGKK